VIFGELWRTLSDVGGLAIWWARQDSNLQPDRYERPALTIELQAPPEPALARQATVPTPLTMWTSIRQCRGRKAKAELAASKADRPPQGQGHPPKTKISKTTPCKETWRRRLGCF
jgi:hypothetical protein